MNCQEAVGKKETIKRVNNRIILLFVLFIWLICCLLPNEHKGNVHLHISQVFDEIYRVSPPFVP